MPRKHSLQLASAALITLLSVNTVSHTLPDDASLADYAFTYRDSLFHVMGWNAGIMFGMAKGEQPADAALFAASARDIATLAPMIPKGFLPNTITADSLAKAEIWDNMEDFNKRSLALAEAANTIAAVADKDLAEAYGMLREFGNHCGNCHREYKVKTD